MAKAPIVTVIDDDHSVRAAMTSLLRSLGLAVYTFSSAEDFLQSPRLNDTSCLITDVQMPGMSGIELQRHLIANGQRLPTIFITAYPEERLRARATEAGAIGYLTKPFDDETLIRCITAALESDKSGTVKE